MLRLYAFLVTKFVYDRISLPLIALLLALNKQLDSNDWLKRCIFQRLNLAVLAKLYAFFCSILPLWSVTCCMYARLVLCVKFGCNITR